MSGFAEMTNTKRRFAYLCTICVFAIAGTEIALADETGTERSVIKLEMSEERNVLKQTPTETSSSSSARLPGQTLTITAEEALRLFRPSDAKKIEDAMESKKPTPLGIDRTAPVLVRENRVIELNAPPVEIVNPTPHFRFIPVAGTDSYPDVSATELAGQDKE